VEAHALRESVLEVVGRALAEDGAAADATSQAVVPESARARAVLRAKETGVLSGCAYATAAFSLCDAAVDLKWLARDGNAVQPGQILLEARGQARGLLAAERTALNFLQRLSGIASLTAAAVAAAGALQVLDTRKTAPGLRDAEKAAVRHGGGINHRRDLEDQILLKENHFALSGLNYAATVRAARAAAGGRLVGAEARSRAEAEQALTAGADYVLLDNFSAAELSDVAGDLRRRFPKAVLEASGGLSAALLPQLAASGLTRVSLGALTHSAPALDLSLLIEPDARL
jgi:nicotinate-nucleotide pyrophosphorylase (carboxylating)